LLSPSYARIEGRCAESVYPFLYLADKNKDGRFLDASIQLINWAEHNGLLLKQAAQIFPFPRQTMEEYLILFPVLKHCQYASDAPKMKKNFSK
jgi:hypothetical protein